MTKLTLATVKLQETIKLFGSTPSTIGEINESATTTTIELDSLPKEFLAELLCRDLTANQKKTVLPFVGEPGDAFAQMVGSPSALHKIVKQLEHPENQTVEIEVGGRWYPVRLTNVNYQQSRDYGTWLSFAIGVSICDQSFTKHFSIGKADFQDDDGLPVEFTAQEILEKNGVRPTTPERVEEFKKALTRSEQIANRVGLVLDVTWSVLTSNKHFYNSRLDTTRLGEKGRPRQIVVEPSMECTTSNERSMYSHGNTQSLPFIRAFSMDLKKYVYADVSDVSTHTFSDLDDARSKLVLPAKTMSILNKVFEGSVKELFGDMFSGRHGGMIVMANGPTGVGKTLTAEVFASYTKRPLYILEMGELGTNLAQVEESLQRVFARATRWNAVLLFDECDVFLARREETDLERSAIVGVFLRLLDRYEGMFFLTSNRADVIDPAFKGRITLKLDYPELNPESRVKIWSKMFEAAGLRLDGKFEEFAEEPLNGRQIRNQVRLLKLTCDKETQTVTVKDVRETFHYAARLSGKKARGRKSSGL